MIGEALLAVEARIGKLSLQEQQAIAPVASPHGGKRRTGQPPKHARLGLTEKQMHAAHAIANHPEAAEAVKREEKHTTLAQATPLSIASTASIQRSRIASSSVSQ